jgi:uncharacterized protein (DUF1697 family)
VRSALTEAEGFTNVKTDISSTTCSFNYSKSEADLTQKLDEISKTNSHVRDWKKKN